MTRRRGRRTALLVTWGTATVLAAAAVLAWNEIRAGYLAWVFCDIGLISLEDIEPNREGDGPSTDTLRVFSRAGSRKWVLGGLGDGGDVFVGDLAVDRTRSRVYVGVGDKTGHRVIALDSRGRLLFRLDTERTSALCVDEQTGNLWCLHDEWAGAKETLVYDLQGNLAARYPWSGEGITHNRCDGSIWIAGKDILKVDRQGRELARGPGVGQRWPDVAPDHRDGSVWVTDNSYHADFRVDTGRLFHYDAEARLVRRLEFKDDRLLSAACDPKTGVVWVIRSSKSARSLERIPPEGEPLPSLPMDAQCLALDERAGMVWLASRDKYIALTPEAEILWEQAREPQGSVHRLMAP